MWIYIASPIIAAIAVLLIVLYVHNKKIAEVKQIKLEDIVGEKCTVVEKIDNFAGCGIVKVKGCQWSARGVDDDDVFEVGETLCVVAIEGVKLICKKK